MATLPGVSKKVEIYTVNETEETVATDGKISPGQTLAPTSTSPRSCNDRFGLREISRNLSPNYPLAHDLSYVRIALNCLSRLGQ